MQLEFDKSFDKAISKIYDFNVLTKVEQIILEVEYLDSIYKLKNIKKLQGYKNFYRIKINDYRLGLELTRDSIIRFITILHRKEIYRKFP